MNFKGSEKKEENKKLEFIVESSADEFEAAIQKAYAKNKNQISIPGFRKGKAPLAVIEGMYGPEVFYQDALDILCNDAFIKGIEEGNVKFIGRPDITKADVTENRCATYTFVVELYPEVELGKYKGVEVTKQSADVTEEEINDFINIEAKKNARIISVDDRPAQMGDTAKIDFEGFLDKEKTNPFDGGKGEDYDLELGSNSFVPGFEEQIVGMKIDDVKDINITFPKEYVEDLAGKDVIFTVKLKGLSYPELPTIDDEFIKDISEFDTLAEYKEDVKKNLENRKQEQSNSMIRADAINKACENMHCEVPQTLINAKIDEIIRNFASNYGVSDPSISTETLASMLGVDENTMNNVIKPTAVTQAKSDLLINAIIEAEKIEASDDDVNAYAEKLAESFGAKVEDIKTYYGNDMLKEEFARDKAIDLIVDNAILVEEKSNKKKSTKKEVEK